MRISMSYSSQRPRDLVKPEYNEVRKLSRESSQSSPSISPAIIHHTNRHFYRLYKFFLFLNCLPYVYLMKLNGCWEQAKKTGKVLDIIRSLAQRDFPPLVEDVWPISSKEASALTALIQQPLLVKRWWNRRVLVQDH